MTVSKPAAQHLRDILQRDSSQPFQGSGSSDHVTRRNLLLSTVGALVLLVLLLAILIV